MDTNDRNALRVAIADKLVEVEDMLKNGAMDYRITLIARHVSNPKAHVMVTSETSNPHVLASEALAQVWANGIETKPDLHATGE